MKTPRPLRWWSSQMRWAVKFVSTQAAFGALTVHTHRYKKLIYALLLTNAVSVMLFGLRLLGAENARSWFMLWNLALAWIAPFIAWRLAHRLRKTSWRTWQNITLSVIWLGFLPNSFYMVSDLIHVQQTGEVSIIFDAVMFTSFIFNGFIAGFLGVILLHRELLACLPSVDMQFTWGEYLGGTRGTHFYIRADYCSMFRTIFCTRFPIRNHLW